MTRLIAKFKTQIQCCVVRAALLVLASVLTMPLTAAAADGQLSLVALQYREGHREAAIARRDEFMRRMRGGLAVITSADRSQPNLYERFTPDTENKDFVFLTGIYDSHPSGDVLVLNPGGDEFREVLYTDLAADEARRLSGIEQVFPVPRR